MVIIGSIIIVIIIVVFIIIVIIILILYIIIIYIYIYISHIHIYIYICLFCQSSGAEVSFAESPIDACARRMPREMPSALTAPSTASSA